MQYSADELKSLTIAELAEIAGRDLKPVGTAAYAKPYLDAMYSIRSINDMYGLDTAYSIVAYFVSNTGSWRGETARLIKAELKNRMKAYEKSKK